jgi:hypothetical protein
MLSRHHQRLASADPVMNMEMIRITAAAVLRICHPLEEILHPEV